MKLWELDWKKSAKYRDSLGNTWSTYLGEMYQIADDSQMVGNINEIFSLSEILDLEFEPYSDIDWSKVEIDTPILVSDVGKWYKGHFAKYENNLIYTFSAGCTSWTRKDDNPVPWKYAKLAEGED